MNDASAMGNNSDGIVVRWVTEIGAFVALTALSLATFILDWLSWLPSILLVLVAVISLRGTRRDGQAAVLGVACAALVTWITGINSTLISSAMLVSVPASAALIHQTIAMAVGRLRSEHQALEASESRIRDLVKEGDQARHALEENVARLKTIYESEPECVKILDSNCTLLDMNPAGLKMISAESLSQVQGLCTLDLISPEYRDLFVEGVESVFRGNKELQVFEIVALDGTRLWMEQHSAPLWDPDSPGTVKEMLAVTRDITQRRKSEERLLHKQRLEALGTLAGGIAHDLNNLLAPIMLSVGELQHVAGVDPELNATLENSVQRASETVRQLLGFARGFEGERETVAVAKVLGDLERFVQATFPKSIVLKVSGADSELAIHGDATQLHQVFLNFSVNSRDAMPDGGRLELEVAPALIEEGFVWPGLTTGVPEPGEYVRFTTRDTGSGIPEDIQKQMFEPFFTTKGPEKGTGLGLSSAMGIVSSHNGFIAVDAPEGGGSEFSVYLPRAEAAIADQVKHVRPVSSGEGRVALLVDDDDTVRLVTRRTLAHQGFEVLTAEHGERALELLEQHATRLDLVISDLRMPGINGMEVLRAASERVPGIGMILMSGDMDEESNAGAGVLRNPVRLHKPFTVKELQSAIRSVERTS